MRHAMFILMLALVASMGSCQTFYDSPQTVLWDTPVMDAGITFIRAEVTVLPYGFDKESPLEYVILGYVVAGQSQEYYVDLISESLVGRYIVAVRFEMSAVGIDGYWGSYGYSDEDQYVIVIDNVAQTFGIQNLSDIRPESMRVQ